jgi:hypothetical protein
MTPEQTRLLAECTVLPLTLWVRMEIIDGVFYAFFNAGPLRYALAMGPPKVIEGIRMAWRALTKGKVISLAVARELMHPPAH